MTYASPAWEFAADTHLLKLHSTVILRVVGGDEKGSLKSETVKKGYAAEGQQHIQKQTRPIVREGAPEKQDRYSQGVINIWS
jgi:hypothetical protein